MRGETRFVIVFVVATCLFGLVSYRKPESVQAQSGSSGVMRELIFVLKDIRTEMREQTRALQGIERKASCQQ